MKIISQKMYLKIYWILFILFLISGGIFIYFNTFVARIIFLIFGVIIGGWMTYGMVVIGTSEIKKAKEEIKEIKSKPPKWL